MSGILSINNSSDHSIKHTARLAQLVERKTFNLVVVGSSPTAGMPFKWRYKGEWRSGLARVAHNHEVDCSIQSSPIFPNINENIFGTYLLGVYWGGSGQPIILYSSVGRALGC